MEKLAQFLVSLYWALREKFQAEKARREHADAVRADPASFWLRRFGGRDARKDSAGSGNAGNHSD